jgi:hypothetical protein
MLLSEISCKWQASALSSGAVSAPGYVDVDAVTVHVAVPEDVTAVF